jgi:hypothetical protein
MQYTFSMTPRMMTLTVVCLVLLCVLLFLVGMEIGQKMAGETIKLAVPDVSKALPAPPKVPSAAELVAPLVPATKP